MIQGTNLVAQVNLLEVGSISEQIDVVANYFIKNYIGNSYLEESETFSVTGSKEYTKEFFTENLPPGTYALGVEIVYPGAFATSSVQFEVVERKGITFYAIAAAVGIVLVGVIIAVVWARVQR